MRLALLRRKAARQWVLVIGAAKHTHGPGISEQALDMYSIAQYMHSMHALKVSGGLADPQIKERKEKSVFFGAHTHAHARTHAQRKTHTHTHRERERERGLGRLSSSRLPL